MSCHEQLAADRVKRHWANIADIDMNMFNLTPFDIAKNDINMNGQLETSSISYLWYP